MFSFVHLKPIKRINYTFAITLFLLAIALPLFGQTIIGTISGDRFSQWALDLYASDNKLFVNNLEADSSDYSDKVFALAQPPNITVTAPDRGEIWEVGSTQQITWTTRGTVGNVKIEYSINNGTSWTDIEASTSSATGSYDWEIPNTPSEECLVKVSETDGDLSDTSRGVFTIATPSTITVTAPNGTESWEVGSTQQITWTSTGTVGNVKIEYSTNNGTSWTDIEASTSSATGSFNELSC
jgi:hypothetical protein